jgi:hypothetical protein
MGVAPSQIGLVSATPFWPLGWPNDSQAHEGGSVTLKTGLGGGSLGQIGVAGHPYIFFYFLKKV